VSVQEAARQLRRYWQRRARGRCVRCGAGTGPSGVYCRRCCRWRAENRQRRLGLVTP